MAVTIKIKQLGPSNKGEVIQYDLSDVAYTYPVTDERKAVVLQPKIDKLTVLFDADDPDQRAAMVQGVVQSPKLYEDGLVSYAAPAKVPRSRYKYSIWIKEPGSGQRILLQAVPSTKKVKRTFRVEFNPTALGKSGLKFFRERFSDIFFTAYSYPQLVQHGKVSRLDIAVDILGVRIDELLLEWLEPGKSSAYFADNGPVETIYFGIKSGKAGKATIYDKLKQLEETSKDPIHGDAAHTRVEMRVQTSYAIKEIWKLQNHLTKLQVYVPSADDPPEEGHHWQHFLDSCRYAGKEHALGLIPSPLRSAYAKALEKAKGHLWMPDRIWETWPDAIVRSGLYDLD